MLLQKAVSVLYPDQCVSCGAMVEGVHALCGSCWSSTPFIEGLVCDACGTPLLGDAVGTRVLCDECMASHPPWDRGRSVLLYRDNARRLILAIKHGDRLDLARPAGVWLARSAKELLDDRTVIVPIPLHWTRMVKRRFNQAALLAHAVASETTAKIISDALIRRRRTPSQEHRTRSEREANLEGSMIVNKGRVSALEGRDVLLIDDVLTSGATFREATRALRLAEVGRVSVLALARVAKDA